MNTIDVIVLKKNILNLSNFGETNRIYKLSDFKREFPFIDTSYKEYFMIDKVNSFENGQKVRYNGENWYVLKLDYLIIENNVPDFISSTGDIHLAEAGNAKADMFRTKTGNVFATKEDAEKRLYYILSGKSWEL